MVRRRGLQAPVVGDLGLADGGQRRAPPIIGIEQVQHRGAVPGEAADQEAFHQGQGERQVAAELLGRHRPVGRAGMRRVAHEARQVRPRQLPAQPLASAAEPTGHNPGGRLARAQPGRAGHDHLLIGEAPDPRQRPGIARERLQRRRLNAHRRHHAPQEGILHHGRPARRQVAVDADQHGVGRNGAVQIVRTVRRMKQPAGQQQQAQRQGAPQEAAAVL